VDYGALDRVKVRVAPQSGATLWRQRIAQKH
jgi:hypothetical protein